MVAAGGGTCTVALAGSFPSPFPPSFQGAAQPFSFLTQPTGAHAADLAPAGLMCSAHFCSAGAWGLHGERARRGPAKAAVPTERSMELELSVTGVAELLQVTVGDVK